MLWIELDGKKLKNIKRKFKLTYWVCFFWFVLQDRAVLVTMKERHTKYTKIKYGLLGSTGTGEGRRTLLELKQIGNKERAVPKKKNIT